MTKWKKRKKPPTKQEVDHSQGKAELSNFVMCKYLTSFQVGGACAIFIINRYISLTGIKAQRTLFCSVLEPVKLQGLDSPQTHLLKPYYFLSIVFKDKYRLESKELVKNLKKRRNTVNFTINANIAPLLSQRNRHPKQQRATAIVNIYC